MAHPAPGPSRPLVSMQTEQAQHQRLTTIVMLGVVLGPITLIAAGIVAAIAGTQKQRMALCALAGLIGLVAGALGWRVVADLGLAAWALGQAILPQIRDRPKGVAIPWQSIALAVWPLLWRWWRITLLLAPLAALNLLTLRVPSAEDLERARLDRERQRQAARDHLARQQLAKAPDQVGGALVLGVPLDGGDLEWIARGCFTYPADSLARHAAVIGASGVGKSETVLRIAAGARQAYGWKVFILDCKGEQPLAERFTATLQAAGAARVGRFPERPLAGWRGDPTALLNRLLAVLDYSEPFYRDMTKMLLNLALEAPPAPPATSAELLERMALAALRQRYLGRPEAAEIDGIRPQDAAGAYNRYRAFFKALGGGLDGGWSFDDVDAGYIRLDGLSLKDQTASLGRYLIEDFAHYAARRKPADERVLLIIDEYPAIAVSGAGTANLFEMVRFHGAAIIVTGQSYAGMGEGFDRILGAAETLILHRTGDPERLLPRAGQRLSFKRRVGTAERGMGRAAREYATGTGSLAAAEEWAIHPNAVKTLPRGECFVIAGGASQRVVVKRVPPAQATVARSEPIDDTAGVPFSIDVERSAPFSIDVVPPSLGMVVERRPFAAADAQRPQPPAPDHPDPPTPTPVPATAPVGYADEEAG